jgi:ribosomal protein L44E
MGTKKSSEISKLRYNRKKSQYGDQIKYQPVKHNRNVSKAEVIKAPEMEETNHSK